MSIRPYSDELSFPVHQVDKKNGQSVGRKSFFLMCHFFLLTWDVQNFLEKSSQSALLNPLGRSTGNNFLFKGDRIVPRVTTPYDQSSLSLNMPLLEGNVGW